MSFVVPGLVDEPDGATPLSEQERAGLKLSWIATRGDLDAEEARNVSAALTQRRWSRMSTTELLDDLVMRNLHKAMFGDVWDWAGRYRTTEKNIGIVSHMISVEVRNLVDDARHWFTAAHFTHDEAAARFHHRLVAIHPFPNGNGRHSRAAADLLLVSVGRPPFSWGGNAGLGNASATRRAYIDALQAADRGDYQPLETFARS